MTEAFTGNTLENWRATLDFPKISRQLAAAHQSLRRDAIGMPLKPNRARVLDALGKVYSLIEFGEYDAARTMLQGLEMFLREAFGWYGVDNAHTPRPLDKPYINRLFWEASRFLLGHGKPKLVVLNDWKQANVGHGGRKWSRYGKVSMR